MALVVPTTTLEVPTAAVVRSLLYPRQAVAEVARSIHLVVEVKAVMVVLVVVLVISIITGRAV